MYRLAVGIAVLVTVLFFASSVSGVVLETLPPGAHLYCAPPPLCDSPYLTFLGRVKCSTWGQPLDVTTASYRDYVSRRLSFIEEFYVAQQPEVKEVVELVKQKLHSFNTPLVLHLAGDNGVGKTSLAEAISLSMGFRCSKRCKLGDTTLEIAASSYGSVSLPEFRRLVVASVASHAKKYPLGGIVIINDINSMSAEHLHVLMPLFGRGSHFPESPSIDLSGLLVIITSDLGKEGLTQNKTYHEVQATINNAFRGLFKDLPPVSLFTFPFLPIGLDGADAILSQRLRRLSCTKGAKTKPAVSITRFAADFLLESVKPSLPVTNGRCVAQAVMLSLEPLVYSELDEDSFVGDQLIIDVKDGEYVCYFGDQSQGDL